MDNIFINYSLFILFLPLAAFVIQIFFGKRLPRQGDWVSVGAIIITLILSMLVMTFADTLASFVGEHEKRPLKFRLWEDEKSLQGSAAMFLSTTLIIYVGTDFFAWFFDAAFFLPLEVLIGCAAFTGMAATLAEAASNQGSDNFSVPLVTAISYEIYLINYTHGTLPALLLWMVGSAAIFFLAHKLRSLNGGGTATAFVMGIFIFGTMRLGI